MGGWGRVGVYIEGVGLEKGYTPAYCVTFVYCPLRVPKGVVLKLARN